MHRIVWQSVDVIIFVIAVRIVIVMTTFNLGKLFLPTKLANSEYKTGHMNNPQFNTYDRVYLDADRSEHKITQCTDYAVMGGADYQMKRAKEWYRAAVGNQWGLNRVLYNNELGYTDTAGIFESSHVIRPVMRIDINAFLKYKNFLAKLGNYTDAKIYHDDVVRQLILGLEFPSEHVDEKTCKRLSRLYESKKLKPTGATYLSHTDFYGLVRSKEYEYWGQKYVRTEVKRHNKDCCFNDLTACPAPSKHTWAKVQPIYFTIRNWDDLPPSINPQGTGKVNYMEVIADLGMVAMPFAFYAGNEIMWQNNVIRAYLNSYDLKKEIDRGNGNSKYEAFPNFNLAGHGFLHEASQSLRARYQNIILDLQPPVLAKQASPTGKLTHLKPINPNHVIPGQEARRKFMVATQESQDYSSER